LGPPEGSNNVGDGFATLGVVHIYLLSKQRGCYPFSVQVDCRQTIRRLSDNFTAFKRLERPEHQFTYVLEPWMLNQYVGDWVNVCSPTQWQAGGYHGETYCRDQHNRDSEGADFTVTPVCE